ncbi:hypothetical protein [Arthrobacter sp.]|uniref:hypothetical protein n=1 Tax=Arthrobacter sp. TaxID=1667 RepID=UPI0033977750
MFTRRNPADLATLRAETAVDAMGDLAGHEDRIDVLILCGSKEDLPQQGRVMAASFNTHASIPERFETADAPEARAAPKTALISAGWDPSMFSINGVYGEALLPDRRRLSSSRSATAAAHSWKHGKSAPQMVRGA